MKASFFYDIRFIQKDEKTYSHFGANNKYVDRYKVIFDEVSVVSRGEKINESNSQYLNSKYEVVDYKVVTYNENYSNILKIVKQQVFNSDFCILRFPGLCGVVAYYYCRKYNKPYVSEVVGNVFEALWYYSLKGKLLAIPFHLLYRFVIYHSKFVSYITETYLQNVYPTKGVKGDGIANVGFDSFDNDLFEHRLNQSFTLAKKRDLVIGLSGSFDAYFKGHDLAIKAISILKKSGINFRMEFVGPGNFNNLFEMCKEYGVEDNVNFKGFLFGRDKVIEWLNGVDIYIQPSRTEGHGRSVVEAIYCGCIAISSDVGGLKDSIPSYARFKKNDYNALAALLIQTINNGAFAHKLLEEEIINVKKYANTNIDDKRKELFNKAICRKKQKHLNRF